MNIVIYTDQNYEYQVKNFIQSLSYAGVVDYKMLYYTIEFESSIKDDRVQLIPWTKRKDINRYEYYKPSICIDSFKYLEGDILFFDSDVIVSKKIKRLKLYEDITHPIFCMGPLEYPYTTWTDHKGQIIFNEVKLMNYLGVKERSMSYIMSCFFHYNHNCLDFLEEWDSFCNNQYLLKDKQSIFPFSDETIANVLLWKKGLSKNYGRRFINTHKFSTFKICEENDDIIGINIDNNMYERCDDSSLICFYHGTKDHLENSKILNYIHENS
jgi:hypothetical protein